MKLSEFRKYIDDILEQHGDLEISYIDFDFSPSKSSVDNSDNSISIN